MPLLAWRPDVVEVPNCAVAMDAWAQLACYPRGSFYPLISGLVLVSIAPRFRSSLNVMLICKSYANLANMRIRISADLHYIRILASHELRTKVRSDLAIGSLGAAFASARHVRLAVKPAFPLTGPGRFPSGLSRPFNSSITL